MNFFSPWQSGTVQVAIEWQNRMHWMTKTTVEIAMADYNDGGQFDVSGES
jgi:hypothetical protein